MLVSIEAKLKNKTLLIVQSNKKLIHLVCLKAATFFQNNLVQNFFLALLFRRKNTARIEKVVQLQTQVFKTVAAFSTVL